MMNKFLDYESGYYFMADYIKVRQLLNELEQRNERGELITWDEYFMRLNLPIPVFFSKQYIGMPMHGFQFKFYLRPSDDEGCIVIFTSDPESL